jgi:hypothetical protein
MAIQKTENRLISQTPSKSLTDPPVPRKDLQESLYVPYRLLMFFLRYVLLVERQAKKSFLEKLKFLILNVNLIVVDENASPDGVELDLCDVDGGEHVLEHGGHQLDLTLLASEPVHDQQRVILELLLVRHLAFQRRSKNFKIIDFRLFTSFFLTILFNSEVPKVLRVKSFFPAGL